MKKFLKDKKMYFINTLIIVAIFIIALIINHISPFGNQVLGKNDAIVQFKPMLFDYITKLRNGTLLNFTFNNALGNPFVFNFIYYLASPLNLVALLFKTPDAMYLSTIIIKLIVGTISITYYVKSKTNNNFIIFVSALSYIFSSWFLTYYYCTMWLDIFAFLPLYQKGLEDLLDKKKFNLYIISLALLTISNIYLAFPVYVYTIIYFIIYELIYKKGTAKEKVLKFDIITLSTIVSFLITSFSIYITFDAFIKSGLKFETGGVVNYQTSFTDFIRSFLYGNTNLLLSKDGTTFPNIACNTFVFINAIYYFFNKKISKKDKIFALVGILLVLGAFYIKRFDFVLNFFHDVRGLTYRYAFIVNFLTIKLLIANLINLEAKDYKKLTLALPIIIIFLLISLKSQDFAITVLNICFIISFFVALIFYKENNFHKLLICLLLIIESFVVLQKNIPEGHEKENINTNLYQKENVKYRLDVLNNDYEENYNYNLYYNGKVTYTFSTINYNRVINLVANLGCYTEAGSLMNIEEGNIIPLMLFNVKKDYYLEKIFAADANILTTDPGIDTTIQTNINNIIFGLTGIMNIYDQITLTATEDDKYYYFETDYDYYLIETINEDGSHTTKPQKFKKFQIEKEYGNKYAIIYVINPDKLKMAHSYLSLNQIKYTTYNDNHLEGTINVDKDQIIFTSIPYDESWEIKIDGKKVKPTIVLDALIGIETTPGEHTISMKYKNNDYIVALAFSLVTLIGYIIFNLKRRKKNEMA